MKIHSKCWFCLGCLTPSEIWLFWGLFEEPSVPIIKVESCYGIVKWIYKWQSVSQSVSQSVLFDFQTHFEIVENFSGSLKPLLPYQSHDIFSDKQTDLSFLVGSVLSCIQRWSWPLRLHNLYRGTSRSHNKGSEHFVLQCVCSSVRNTLQGLPVFFTFSSSAPTGSQPSRFVAVLSKPLV